MSPNVRLPVLACPDFGTDAAPTVATFTGPHRDAASLSSAVPMSCWVVPTIAAELWGVPLDQVLSGIRAGAVVSKLDYGFTLVDVAPDSRKLAPPPPARPIPPPITFIDATVLEEAEEVALADVDVHVAAPADAEASLVMAASEHVVAADAVCMAEAAAEPPAPPVLEAAVEPTIAAGENSPGARRVRQVSRPFRSSPLPPDLADNAEHESEDGPDPNYGEPDDGQPLNWRDARTRAAATRRRPPRFN